MSCRVDGKLTEVSEEHPENASSSMLVTEVAERSTNLIPVEPKAPHPISCRLDGKLTEVSEKQNMNVAPPMLVTEVAERSIDLMAQRGG